MDESNQVFKLAELFFDKHILALSWNIATEPKLYRKLAPNPYSPTSLQIISERFTDENTNDIIKAIILAEPEGEYDRNFRQFTHTQQEEELTKQNDISAEINERLIQYYKKYAKESSRLPKEFLYNGLSIIAFRTADVREVEKKYSQNQRRDFRLSIVNFIQHLDSLTSTNVVSDEKSPPRRLFLKVAYAAFVLIIISGLAILQSIIQYPELNKQVLAIETSPKASQGLPVRLKIPSINVDAAVEYVGLTSSGAMGVPDSTADVGWFDLGPRPGENGSAVIAGHFNGENDEAGAFINLNKLKEGDRVYIEDDKGTTTSFVVRTSRTYDPGYADDVFSGSNSAHLNLITCDGVWDGVKKTYSKRLVVFADITQ